MAIMNVGGLDADTKDSRLGVIYSKREQTLLKFLVGPGPGLTN